MNASIDCLSVAFSGRRGDTVASGHTFFTGRYWTGCISIEHPASGSEPITADLRAGVGAISWLNEELADEESPVVVSGSDDGSIDIWQCHTAAQTLEHVDGKAAHDHVVSSLSCCPGSNRIATSSWDLRVSVWDAVPFLENAATFVGHTDLVHSVTWAGHGKGDELLFSASQDKTIRQWDLRAGSCSSILRMQQPVYVVALQKGTNVLAAGDELGSLSLYDMRKSNVQLANLPKLHHDAIRALAFPAQESKVLIASSGDDGRICVMPQGQPISSLKQQVRTPHGDGAYIRALGFGCRGLYSGSWDGRVECSVDLRGIPAKN